MKHSMRKIVLAGSVALALPAMALAQQVRPKDVLADDHAVAGVPLSAPEQAPGPGADGSVALPVVQPLPGRIGPDGLQLGVVQQWSLGDAVALLGVIEAIGSEGLEPADYEPDALRNAISAGAGEPLNQAASESFSWLVEDMRDGRTPMAARKQWFVVDPDADRMPTVSVMAEALATHDIWGTLESLAPTNPDYAALKQALADTDPADTARTKLIRANMDRWRWLAHDLGPQYLMTNVPEYQLRLTVGDQIIRTYKTVVGKPGRTATPQLAELVQGVIFNPTWTVPQSIVVGEGLGSKVLANPGWAKTQGYTATRSKSGTITVVQQPGPANSLGLMKLDMPNPHAIYLHDTPSRYMFARENRALSHGCIRTERALELAITMAILGGGATKDEAVAIASSGKYTRVVLAEQMPVYITYFTMGRDITGKLRSFDDIYDRDAPVLAALDQPRQANRARRTSEKVIEIDDDLQS